MRILLICKRYYTNKDLLKDKFGRLYHLPKQLANRGINVLVLAFDYRNSVKKELTEDNLIIQSIPTTPSKILSAPVRVYLKSKNFFPDIVIASADSHIGLLGLLIARKFKIPFVFDVYDYYPAFNGNKIPGFKFIFHTVVKKANLLLCTSTSLEKKLILLNANTSLIQNGVDTNLFHPMDMMKTRAELGLALDALYIGYFGSIDASRGPLLIEAGKVLRKKHPKLRLLLAGKIKGVNISYPWIQYFGNLPHNKIPNLINSCDLVAIPYAKTSFNDYCGACKIAEYLACGKPIVATKVSDHEHLLVETPASLCDPNYESMVDSLQLQLLQRKCATFSKKLTWTHIGSIIYSELNLLQK
ncbi:glycosyltransferase [Desulforhopalus singaporensis]|uniref:Glycosyltransferase involved in cell wall bisynthesis n=1 Tax=Desulforhopalus singaporensis TaxID=91360 RepID=A0A1H0QQ38_9BACT|nr:glycosyltransferase [Desulforhopalus singaporensis]SDP19477.1 Glycosyltransferase involved in cell wall bisynthesis [Desulforhopalus singaporensis]